MKIERIIGVRQDVNTLSKEEEILPFIATTSKNIQLFKVETTSLEPEINLGDIVFYDNRNQSVTDGSLYVIATPNGTVVKRLIYKASNHIEAVCNYSNFIIDKNCEILGRVIYCLQAK